MTSITKIVLFCIALIILGMAAIGILMAQPPDHDQTKPPRLPR